MKVKKITIIFVLAGILTNSCVDELDVNIDREEFILVIEGFITTRSGPHLIKITRSAKYGSFLAGVIKDVTNAKVLIRDQNGDVTLLSEFGFGEYLTPVGFRAVVGNSYILQLTVASKTYFSTPELVTKAPEIDSLIIAYKKLPSADPFEFASGVEIYSQWQDPADEDNYYMWKSSGTYQIETHPEDHIVIDGFGNAIPAPLDCCSTCWVDEFNTDKSIKILRDNNSNGNLTTNLAAFIADDGGRYMDKYHVTIEQHSISKDAFLFFELLNNQISIDGNIFDPPPATIRGNMINLENPDESVIGYFRASDVAVKSIFIPRDILEDTQALKVINNDCRVLRNSTDQRPSYWLQ